MLKKPGKYFWIANAFIVLSLILFFSRSIFTSRILAPPFLEAYPFFVGNPLLEISSVKYLCDPIERFIPWYHFDKQMFITGQLPLWNPYQGCGAPQIANIESSFFYPLNIFPYLLNWKWGLFFLYFFKLYFVGLFLYLYLREIDTSPHVSIGIAVAGTFISYILGGVYNIIMNTAFFFPLGLWSIELIVNPVTEPPPLSGSSDGYMKPLKSATFANGVKNQNHFKGYLIFCIGFAFAIFGGFPELVFYSICILSLYLFIRLFETYDLKLYKEYLPLLGNFIIICVIAILISAIQLIPFLQYFVLSSLKVSRNISGTPLINLPIYSLILCILPPFTINFTNLPATTSFSILLIGIVGMLTLKKDKIVKTFIIIFIIALCTGFYIPYIYNLIIKIPGFDIGKNMYLGIFIPWSLLIISAKTLDNLTRDRIRLSFNIAIVSIFLLLIILGFFFLYNHTGSSILSASLAISYFSNYIISAVSITIIIIISTLLILRIKNRKLLITVFVVFIFIQTAVPQIFYKSTVKPAYFYPKNKIFSLLLKEKKPFRVVSLPDNDKTLPYNSNINTFYDIEDIRNSDAILINWYTSIASYMEASDILNLTNVKYVIVKSDYNLSNLTNVFQPMAEYNGFILYKNLSAFNRAFMIYNYAVADGQQRALDLLHLYSGQLNTTAIVFRKDAQAMPPTASTQGTYKINFIKYTPGYIKMTCNTSQPGLFFISDTYFPGWHARVDGKRAKVIRTDYAFQGLWLTQGSHTIKLYYAPSSFKYGALLSILGILSLIGFYFIAFRKKKLLHKV